MPLKNRNEQKSLRLRDSLSRVQRWVTSPTEGPACSAGLQRVDQGTFKDKATQEEVLILFLPLKAVSV